MFLWKNFSDHQTPFFEASLKFGVTLPVNIWHKDQIIPFLLAAALNSASFPGVCRLTRYKAPATLQELIARAPCPYCPAPNTLPCSWLRRGAQHHWVPREGKVPHGSAKNCSHLHICVRFGFSASHSQVILLIIFHLNPLYSSDSVSVHSGLGLHLLLLDVSRCFGGPVQPSKGLLAFPVSCVYSDLKKLSSSATD